MGDERDGDGDWTDVPFDGTDATRAAAVPSRTSLLPRWPGGAGPAFTWPEVPPAGWSPNGGSATGGPAVTGSTRPGAPPAVGRARHVRTEDVCDLPSGATAQAGAPAPGVAGGDPAAADVASAERKARLAAVEAARLKVKFDNYRSYHKALNYRDSAAARLLVRGLWLRRPVRCPLSPEHENPTFGAAPCVLPRGGRGPQDGIQGTCLAQRA